MNGFIFRPHHQFVEDVTDAFLVAAFLDIMKMDDLNSKPIKLPVLSLMDNKQKENWLNTMSEAVIESLGLTTVHHNVRELRSELMALNTDDQQFEAMKIGGSYQCAIRNSCYTSRVWFKIHSWNFHKANTNVDETNAVKHFLYMSLLYRDMCNSYRMGDGDRITRDAYFEWLYDASLKHTKYKIWLWRMITYVLTILGCRESFEYKWNMCVNLHGGIQNNIPNDNCVELQVKHIKNQLNTQGVNKSFSSARKVCKTTQVVEEVKQQMIKTTKTARSKRERPSSDNSKDIICMVQCLRQQGLISEFCWDSFSSFRDPIQCIDAEELHSWINSQKKIAGIYM